MTDVVAIAKERRARLVAEIARLDEFLQLAEALMKYGQGLRRGPVAPADPAAPMVLLSELDTAPAAGADPAGDGAAEDDELVLTDEVADPAARSDAQGTARADAQADLEVGQRLRQRRWMLGMTKKGLSERAGIPVDEIHRCEKGETRLTTSQVWQLATALRVPMAYFFEEKASHAPAGETPSRADSETAAAKRATVVETA